MPLSPSAASRVMSRANELFAELNCRNGPNVRRWRRRHILPAVHFPELCRGRAPTLISTILALGWASCTEERPHVRWKEQATRCPPGVAGSVGAADRGGRYRGGTRRAAGASA